VPSSYARRSTSAATNNPNGGLLGHPFAVAKIETQRPNPALAWLLPSGGAEAPGLADTALLTALSGFAVDRPDSPILLSSRRAYFS
jgi:hypothetical protein